jgi:myosin-15
MADWWSYWAIVGDPFTGQQQIKVKKVKPPAKVQIPQGEETEEEEEETTAGRVARQGPPGSCTCAAFDHLSFLSVPSPPPPPVVKKPLKQDAAKAAKEAEVKPDKKAGPGQSRAPVVHSSNSAPQRPEPSKEIRNIIRMYQSRPAPVPVPVQPVRWAPGGGGQGCLASQKITPWT